MIDSITVNSQSETNLSLSRDRFDLIRFSSIPLETEYECDNTTYCTCS